MPTIDDLRAEAREHARQLDAVLWLTVNDLAVRWGVSANTVRKIPREQLPYLTLGGTAIRRYDPRDVERYEDLAKHAPERGAEEPAA